MKKIYNIQGIDITIDESDPNVFQPHPITKLLANSIEIHPDDEVLEIGSGSGLIAITAAKLGAKQVYASDISELACQATKNNGIMNGLNGELIVHKGDFFEPFSNQIFDVIISNPPCMPFPIGAVYKNEGISLAVNGGEDGTESMERFIRLARNYIKTDGVIYLPLPKWSNWKKTMNHIKHWYNSEIVKSENIHFYPADNYQLFDQHINQLVKNKLIDTNGLKNNLEFEVQVLKLKLK